MSVSCRFFGTPIIEVRGKSVTSDFSNKKLELLIYLAIEQCKFTREHLANLFWEDADESRGRQSLRQAISDINKVYPDLVNTDGKKLVGLNEEAVDYVDIWDFEEANNHNLYKQIADLYKAEFLAGYNPRNASNFFEEWLRSTREYFHQIAENALGQLLQQATKQKDTKSIQRYARQLLTITPWDENAYRHLMLNMARQRKFDDAIKLYEQCRKVLYKEFRKLPSSLTAATYQQIEMARYTIHRQLVSYGTPFVGRERELQEVSNLLKKDDCRLLTLLGIGGVGKTRIAVEIASQTQWFLHGACFISSSGHSLQSRDALLTSFLETLNLSLTVQDGQQQLYNYLQPRELLIVVDGFEHNVASARLLSDILQKAPNIKFLVTSRVQLDVPEEWIYDVQGMRFPVENPDMQKIQTARLRGDRLPFEQFDAISFYLQCVHRIKLDFSLQDHISEVMAICQFIEGLPLGIELIASWIRQMPINEVVTTLSKEQHKLLEEPRNFPEQHRNLQIVFENSWSLLTAEEKNIFQQLAVFEGYFSLAAAQNITGASREILNGLSTKSMLQVLDNDRCYLHALLRIFANKKLSEAGKADISRKKHFDYYLEFVRQRLPDLKGLHQIATLQEIEGEVENIQVAWHWGIENIQDDKLIILLEGTTQLHLIRNYYVTGIQFIESALPQTRKAKNLHVQLMLNKSLFHVRLGEYEVAKQCVESVINECRKSKDGHYIAQAHYILGYVEYETNQYEQAEEHLQYSLSIFRTLEDRERIANCLLQIGLVAAQSPMFSSKGKIARYKPPKPFFMEHYPPSESKREASTKAIVFFEQALENYQAIGDILGQGLALHCIGYAYYNVCNYDLAATHFERAISLLEKTKSNSDLAQSINWLAWTLQWQGNAALAKKYFLQALQTAVEALAYKRLLDCLMKYALFIWTHEKSRFMALAIVVLVAQHPNTDGRIRVSAQEWSKNIGDFLSKAEVEHATNFGTQQTLISMTYTLSVR